jgi:hypothetical protein
MPWRAQVRTDLAASRQALDQALADIPDAATYERRPGETLEDQQARLMADLLEARTALDRAISRLLDFA